MRLIVLGAGAGGGLPQWNCGCRHCEGARSGRIPAMTQSSVAVSEDGTAWAVINASPDIRAQLAGTPDLHPRALRASPIAAVLLTNGDLDHVAGLLTLREGQPFRLLATPAIHAALAANPMLDALDPRIVRREVIAMDTPFDLLPGLVARLLPVPGKVPLYLEEGEVVTDAMGEETVAVELTSGARRAVYAPACAAMPVMLRARLDGADLLLLDGTVWTDDEMPRAGLSAKTGRRMGHMAVSGEDGSMSVLRDTDIARKILIHINNSNPLVDPESPARTIAAAAGWDIAYDGMEVTC